jgi:hypothetical protein
MNLADVREIYYDNTGKVSDIVRQLGLAGLAVIWVFRLQAPDGAQVIPKQLFLAGTFILIGLTVDLTQYAVASTIWQRFNRQKEKELSSKANPEEADFEAPEKINVWPDRLFWTKLGLVVIAYLILIFYLAQHVLDRS